MNRRPIGVTILGWWSLASGIAILLTEGRYLLEPSIVRETIATMGLTIPLYLFQTGLIPIARVFCGLGLLLGKRWSWWLGLFLEANFVVITVYSIGATGVFFSLEYYLKLLAPLLIAVVIVNYLFRRETMSFFHIEKLKLAPALGIIFGANLMTVLALGASSV